MGRQELSRRLGLNVPKGWFPTAPMLKGLEAAGFTWVQVHAPPPGMLCDRERLLRHAGALRATLETSGLHLVLHAPDDLSAGEPAHDRALDGLLDYAAATGARQVVYHGANLEVADGGEAATQGPRPRRGRGGLAGAPGCGRLERLGVTLAIENLAPVHPGPPRLCHDPAYVHALVERLDSPRVRMALDVGHANISAGLLGAEIHELVDAGPRRRVDVPPARQPRGAARHRLAARPRPAAARPPSAAGQRPAALGGASRSRCSTHRAPLVLEIHPPHRPEPLSLASVTAEVLLRDRPSVGGAPRSGLASVPLG